MATVAFVVTATLGGVAAAYAGLATLGFLNGKTRRASRTTTRQGIFLTSSLGGCIGWATVALVSVAEGSVILVVTFLLLMPIVNGTFDWLSWWISRWCGSNLVRTLATQPGPFSVISTITKHGAIDLGAAVVLFLGLSFCFGWSFGLVEYRGFGSEWGRNLEIGQTITDAVSGPWNASHGLWFTVMLLSTLVPTLFHFLFVLASPMVLVGIRRTKRHELAAKLGIISWESMEQFERHQVAIEVLREIVRYSRLIWVPAVGVFGLLSAGTVVLVDTIIGMPDAAEWVGRFAKVGMRLAESIVR